jgi:hypothetical protein
VAGIAASWLGVLSHPLLAQQTDVTRAAIGLALDGRTDAALKLIGTDEVAAKSSTADLLRAIQLHAAGKRASADSAIRRAAIRAEGDTPVVPLVSTLLDAWQDVRRRMPRISAMQLTPTPRGVQFSATIGSRIGGVPAGRRVWRVTALSRTDTVCVAVDADGCEWDGRVRGTAIESGDAQVSLIFLVGGFETPVEFVQPVRIRWEDVSAPAPPAILPETLEVVGRDVERHRRWLQWSAIVGGVGALTAATAAAQAGAISVNEPESSSLRSLTAAAYLIGGTVAVASVGVAAWSWTRRWTKRTRFVRPEVVAANAARLAAWRQAMAARASAPRRLVVEAVP